MQRLCQSLSIVWRIWVPKYGFKFTSHFIFEYIIYIWQTVTRATSSQQLDHAKCDDTDVGTYGHEGNFRITGYHSNQQTEGDPLSAANSLMLAGFQYSPDDWHTKDHTYGIKKSSGWSSSTYLNFRSGNFCNNPVTSQHSSVLTIYHVVLATWCFTELCQILTTRSFKLPQQDFLMACQHSEISSVQAYFLMYGISMR